MSFPLIAAFYASLFGLFYLALSLWVSVCRFQLNVTHGDGGQDVMNRRIRAHGNFSEYIPLILLIVALVEAQGGAAVTIHVLLLPLFVTRLLHPIGMLAPVGSKRQFLLRGGSIFVTWLVLAVASVVLLAGTAPAIL